MRRVDELRAQLLELFRARFRAVFHGAELWGGGTEPNSLQFTQMGSLQNIANHWDRRDKWDEGIATAAWSELPSVDDLRGEPYTLVMEKGPIKALQSVKLALPPGSAYALMGAAQGCTHRCERGLVGHHRCNCCWTHGIRLVGAMTRQSMTLRALAGAKSDVSDSVSDADTAEAPES